MDPITILLTVGIFVSGGFFTVFWWLIRKRDEKRDAEIRLLWEKHDEDANRLRELELDIANSHYVKAELDSKFDKLEFSIRSGLDNLGSKLDKFALAVIESNGVKKSHG